MGKTVLCFAEESVRNLPEFADVARRFSCIEWIEDYQGFRRESMRREKECIVFARKRGSWLKPFHCYDANGGFRYFSLDLAEGCAFDCAYCYLQTYLNHGALVLFLDLQSLQHELRQIQGKGLWISTGLLTDSLLAEKCWPVVAQISQRINAGNVLELRTKSHEISVLADQNIQRDRIVVSWSLNPERIVQNFEYRALTLQQRLEAAEEAIRLGYRIGFHLDPVFHYDGWKAEYESLIGRLRDFPLERVAFLSLGLFRYMPELGSMIRRRFPFHSILTGEFFPDADGKYHYLRAIRKEMYAAFSEWLRPWSDSIPVFYAMEPDERLVPSAHR